MKDKQDFIKRACNFLQDLQDNYEIDDLFGFFAEPDFLFDKLNNEIQTTVHWKLESQFVILKEIARLFKRQYGTDVLPSYSDLTRSLQEFQKERMAIADKIYELYCQEPLFVNGDLDDEANSLDSASVL